MRVKNTAQAMQLIDDHEYGNGTCIFTSDGKAARFFQVILGWVWLASMWLCRYRWLVKVWAVGSAHYSAICMHMARIAFGSTRAARPFPSVGLRAVSAYAEKRSFHFLTIVKPS